MFGTFPRLLALEGLVFGEQIHKPLPPTATVLIRDTKDPSGRLKLLAVWREPVDRLIISVAVLWVR